MELPRYYDFLSRDPWVIKKTLGASDIGDHHRLTLERNEVRSHVVPHIGHVELAEKRAIQVMDIDTDTEGSAKHTLWLARCGNGTYILQHGWRSDFVKRRDLVVGDRVGLCWDSDGGYLRFSVLSRKRGDKHEPRGDQKEMAKWARTKGWMALAPSDVSRQSTS